MLIATWLLCVTTSHAATVLVLDGQPGDYIAGGLHLQFTPADGTFAASADPSAVLISFHAPDFSHFWDVMIQAPQGGILALGPYENATRFGGSGVPALDVFGDGRGCNTVTGRFLVLELVTGADGSVSRFAADFEQHCEDSPPALFGSVRFNSDAPLPVACSDSDGDGEEDATDACANTPVGEDVNVAGCSLLQFCSAIDASTRLGRRACHVADWKNDGLPTGASRDCKAVRDDQGAYHCLPVGGLQHPRSFLSLASETGDFVGAGLTQLFTTADGLFTAGLNFDNGVSVSLNGPSHFWTVDLAAPGSAPLVPGQYSGATRFPFQSPTEPGLTVNGDGRGCNMSTGSFVVRRVVVSPPDTVEDFAADFEQFCDGSPAALHGTVEFHRPIRYGLPCHDTDGDGEPDATDVCPGTVFLPVDQAGCSIEQFCAAIDTTTGRGRFRCRHADWGNNQAGRAPHDCMVSRFSGFMHCGVRIGF
jgi:hypothetical protein